MKIATMLICALTGFTTVIPVQASALSTWQTSFVVSETAHGGGCRKSSPKGQCCHAGSQPLHCH